MSAGGGGWQERGTTSHTEEAALRTGNAGEGTWGVVQGHSRVHQPELHKIQSNEILISREDCPE